MKYLRSACTGLGMSIIGTSLCAAKMAQRYDTKMCYIEDYAMRNHWKFYDKGWSVPGAFLGNMCAFIPTAVLGSVFHDYAGKDLCEKLNKSLGTDIAPYMLNGVVFGTIGSTATFFIITNFTNKKDVFYYQKPFAMSTALIEGFVIGVGAVAGAYAGTEAQYPSIDVHLHSPLDTHNNDL